MASRRTRDFVNLARRFGVIDGESFKELSEASKIDMIFKCVGRMAPGQAEDAIVQILEGAKVEDVVLVDDKKIQINHVSRFASWPQLKTFVEKAHSESLVARIKPFDWKLAESLCGKNNNGRAQERKELMQETLNNKYGLNNWVWADPVRLRAPRNATKSGLPVVILRMKNPTDGYSEIPGPNKVPTFTVENAGVTGKGSTKKSAALNWKIAAFEKYGQPGAADNGFWTADSVMKLFSEGDKRRVTQTVEMIRHMGAVAASNGKPEDPADGSSGDNSNASKDETDSVTDDDSGDVENSSAATDQTDSESE